jgi:ribonucleoside-diphosphate reductase alpha chain
MNVFGEADIDYESKLNRFRNHKPKGKVKPNMKTRKVDVKIQNPDGSIVFQKDNFEVPEDWSDRAATIVASKYAMDSENSVIDIVDRVVNQITGWGVEQEYFSDPMDSIGNEKSSDWYRFSKELREILLDQRAAFNSPVWFNCGSDSSNDQMSACFIVPVEDTMESILEHNTIEGNIFKGGSGAGCNVSSIRAKGEKLSNKGEASGPVSFMKMWDSTAGVIKSGGKTRRSAKMICMDTDHPDILNFIDCKKIEEDKAKILIEKGFSPEEAYDTVAFQNTNHSIRVSDDFMKAVKNEAESGMEWNLINRGNGYATPISAKKIFRAAAEIAWATGDPGIQYDSRMNLDNPVPSVAKINGTNPCSEFSAIDNSSCNLASLNLMKYYEEGQFQWVVFENDIKVLITAMDILIDAADYPTEEIRKTTVATRPLGLGFSNLGALLMIMGLPYDSIEGREMAAEITKRMTTAAYRQSHELGNKLGSFEHYKDNLEVNYDIIKRLTGLTSLAESIQAGGLRNSQVTLLAPTGTISFMMDCDTTGVEPLFALKTIKTLAGGGTMEIDYPCVEEACDIIRSKNRGSQDITNESIIENYQEGLFDTSNEIPWKAHIDMMAACQQHLNGAISKTVNMPADATSQDIMKAYMYGWNAGLKCIAIYRDGSKGMQPMVDANKKEEKPEPEPVIADSITPGVSPSARLKPTNERDSITNKIDIGGHEGYVTAGMYPDGSLCEIFIRMSKEGSLVSGIMDAFATSVSLGLQHGVPLSKLVEKFKNTQFQPSGFTSHEEIGYASSIVDYIFKWLELRFLEENIEEEEDEEEAVEKTEEPKQILAFDGAECNVCGNITSKVGTCYLCSTCGTTSGCS